MTRVLALLAAAALLVSASDAGAAACRDPAGKFIACPAKATATAQKGPCRDSHGKFIKCPPKTTASATPDGMKSMKSMKK
jgi:hypothetical protein